MRNGSDDIHPIHLHRYSFELTKIAGKSLSGVMKDVVMVGGYQEVKIDFTAGRLSGRVCYRGKPIGSTGVVPGTALSNTFGRTQGSTAEQVKRGTMAGLRQKRPRLVLAPTDYGRLRDRVLQRDGWRCHGCGSRMNLQVHHLVWRSQLKSDEMENLITLCGCHSRLHNTR